MLSEIKMVGSWVHDEPEDAWNFEEITFDAETRRILETLSRQNWILTVFPHSAKVLVSQSANICYIPGQYFLYALKMIPFLMLLKKYQKVLAELSLEVRSRAETIRVLQSRDRTPASIAKLDTYSQEQFFRIYEQDTIARLGAKSIIKNESEHRTPADFFKSILLAAIPVPNSSSDILAHLLLAIAEDELVFQHLQEKYIHAVSWLFRAEEGDELLFRVLSALGWAGKLDGLHDTEPVIWGDIADAFLVRPTDGPNNIRYMSTPVHFLESCRKYVFIKKGLLNADTIHVVSAMVETLWPGMCIRLRDGCYFFEAQGRRAVQPATLKGGTNKIFYGAPGTGKSHKLHEEFTTPNDTFVTVFHPDTQHADFVGALKPLMKNDQVEYRFRAGPFTKALLHALKNPDRKVGLIIEEINRASAAAVFGELFQLLDRDPDGGSRYCIHVSDPDMLGYVNAELEQSGCAPLDVLRIPSNFSLFATMNSSDQAVMPLDTAFKRRWSFEYFPIDFKSKGVPKSTITLSVASGSVKVTWPRLAESINKELLKCDVPEDRLIGPFFLSSKELENEQAAKAALAGKLFIYLWDDVLRHYNKERIFSSDHKTFGDLSAAFVAGQPVFSKSIESQLTEVVQVDVDS